MTQYNFVCLICQKPFTNKNTNLKYCSRKCYSQSKYNTPENFWSQVDKNGPNGCWLWTGQVNEDGYGRVKWKCKSVAVHRLACELSGKPIPENLRGLHHCDNPPCCNPDHIYPGTQFDNMRDRKVRGRDYDKHGEGNPNAKLNYQKAQHIRELYASGLHTHLSLSKEFSVSANTINSVLTGKTWV
jgi:hypothetical protein